MAPQDLSSWHCPEKGQLQNSLDHHLDSQTDGGKEAKLFPFPQEKGKWWAVSTNVHERDISWGYTKLRTPF